MYAIIETIVRETEDVDTLLLEERDRKRKHKRRESKTGEESKYEDTEEIIILDNLMTALEKRVGNSTRDAKTYSKKRTGKELRAGRTKGEVTQGKRSPGNEKTKLSNEERNTERESR